MSRQNCKNCGEPYNFDNLVTPGRATMKCVACQRQIYVHTGQILAEPSPLQEKAREEIEQIVMVVSHTGTDIKPRYSNSSPASVEKRETSTTQRSPKGWKRSSKPVAPTTPDSAEGIGFNEILNVMEEVQPEGSWFDAYSLYQIAFIGVFYCFSLFWGGIALYILLTTAYPLLVSVFFVALMVFLALCSVAVAEILKNLWRNED